MSDPVKAAAANYTLDDIYTFLYDAMRGQSSISGYSLPRINFYLYRIAAILAGTGDSVPTASNSISARLSTMSGTSSNQLKALKSLLYVLQGDDNLDARYVRPYIQDTLYRFDSNLNTVTISDDIYTILDQVNNIAGYVAQVHGDGQNTNYYLSNISSAVSDIASRDISWYQSGDVLGLTTEYNGSYITQSDYQTGTRYLYFHVNNASSNYLPGILRLFVPLMCPWSETTQRNFFDVSITSTGGDLITDDIEVFTGNGGYYVFAYDFYNIQSGNENYVLKFTVNVPSYYSVGSGSVYSLPIDSIDYQLWAERHYTRSQSGYLKYLADNLVDPSVSAAKDESQPVIDDTLDGFTGDGSAAPSTGDTGSMKGISGSVRSGLDTGASAGDAVSVFSNNDFWGWFSQDNNDKINNAYPAPDVNSMFNTRAPGDYVPDFISGDQDYLSDHLGSDSW